MKKRGCSFLGNEQGSIIVLFACSMVLILGMLGLVIDMGFVYKEKSDLKKAATTAALSGAQELTNGDAVRVENVVNTILASYQEETSLHENGLKIELDQEVRVTLIKEVPFVFAKIFGFDSITVEESAAARLFPIGGMRGVAPLGIDESVLINYGDIVPLKVGPGDSEEGNFGILALEGPGAKTYEETLKYGFDHLLSVGDSVSVQTGNIADKTSEGVNYRLSQCPNPDGNTNIRECARIVPVAVYRFDETDNKKVVVTGFAFFYIEPPDPNDTSVIRGKFIKRVDTGTYTDDSQNRGAYMSRLVE